MFVLCCLLNWCTLEGVTSCSLLWLRINRCSSPVSALATLWGSPPAPARPQAHSLCPGGQSAPGVPALPLRAVEERACALSACRARRQQEPAGESVWEPSRPGPQELCSVPLPVCCVSCWLCRCWKWQLGPC